MHLFLCFRRSEEEGIQLLGPDDVAIWKVRIFTLLVATIIQNTALVCCDVPSGIFALFYQKKPLSYDKEFARKKVSIIYIVLPATSLVVNVLAKVVSHYGRRRLEIISSPDDQSNKKEIFLVSVTAVILIPFVLLLSSLFSLSSRYQRLVYFFPLQLTTLSLFIPLLIILRSEKMRKEVRNQIENCVIRVPRIFLFVRSNKIVPIVAA